MMRVSGLAMQRPNLYGRHVAVVILFAYVEKRQVARVGGKA